MQFVEYVLGWNPSLRQGRDSEELSFLPLNRFLSYTPDDSENSDDGSRNKHYQGRKTDKKRRELSHAWRAHSGWRLQEVVEAEEDDDNVQ